MTACTQHYIVALEAGMLRFGPAQQRAMVRDWLVALLDAEGQAIELREPTAWDRWDRGARRWTP
ncbi:MAG: hypothetical protein JOZ07_19100 [Solirubrobacterales bacterium]|nr:hypothetical protein [Solirubrobacterales bacterium]